MTSGHGSSLEKTLAAVLSRDVAEGALACAGAADRVFLENVALLAQQTVPELDVTRTEKGKAGEVYTLRVPWSAGEVRVSLAQLHEVETYSPCRVLDVSCENGWLVVKVGTETRPIAFKRGGHRADQAEAVVM